MELPAPSVYFLSVYCMYVLFIYTILISIILVLQEERGLIASNEQVYDFYKWVIFEKKGIVENFFLMSVSYSV